MPLKGSGYRKIDRMFLKRITDVAISLAVLACAGTGLLLIAAWIKLDSKGPALLHLPQNSRGPTYFVLQFLQTDPFR